MKKFIIALITLLCSISTVICIAEPAVTAPIILKDINPSFLAPLGSTAIFLDQLEVGVDYTITCDLFNPNYDTQYPAVISMNSSTGLVSNIRFIVNDIPRSFKQANLSQNVNKYVARNVKRLNLNRGVFLSLRSYDETDSVYIDNCIATASS